MCGSIGTDIGIKYFSLVHAYRIIILLNIWIVRFCWSKNGYFSVRDRSGVVGEKHAYFEC